MNNFMQQIHQQRQQMARMQQQQQNPNVQVMQSMPDNRFLREQVAQQTPSGPGGMRYSTTSQPPNPALMSMQKVTPSESYSQNTSFQSQQQPMSPSQPPPLTTQSSSSQKDNFKVVIRLRPPLERELDSHCQFRPIVSVSPDNRSCAIMEYLGAEVNESEKQRDMDNNPHLCVWQNFNFDYVYDNNSTQEFVYENTAKQAVSSVLEGYNATVLAYGQTGTGKTFTMEGFKYNAGDPQKGIIPRSMEEIFRYIQMQQNKNTTFMVRASYLQIYNESISDLLKVDRTSLQIREDKKKGVFVEGLSEWAVRSPNEVYSLMQKGALSRASAPTKMNDISSRSHAVFIIIVEQMTTYGEDEDAPRQIRVGKLNLVDLAGSERVGKTGATGKRLEESKKINQSLSALGNVIAALTDPKSRTHIPYRDSKLTRILEDSLGGNCRTTMMAMISPAAEAFGESLSTLQFATRAKKVKNQARINEDVDQRALLRQYEVELKRLKQELNQKNSQITTGTHSVKLEEERKRAEEDKNAAISALEMRSREVLIEKEQKRQLEDKIRVLTNQLLQGGQKIEDTPQFRVALEEKQKIIRQEYETKLQEIEKERNLIEEDKAQVDRYKQLLLKQRDIMIALTSRLNERDETIIQLQEELDAYDRIHRETENVIEAKNLRMMQLEAFIKDKCGREVPHSQFNDEYPNQLGSGSSGDRKYAPMAEFNDGEDQMLLTADEKVDELMQVIQMQQNDMENSRGGAPDHRLMNELTNQSEEFNSQKQRMQQQLESMAQEKQAFFLISNDIQGLLGSTMQDVQSNDGQRTHHAAQKLVEISKLVQSMQKHSQQVQSTSARSSYNGNENYVPLQQRVKGGSAQPSPQPNKQAPVHKQGTPRSSTIQNEQAPNSANKHNGLPPKHAIQNQHSMPVTNTAALEGMPVSVSEMLRKRAEMKKVNNM